MVSRFLWNCQLPRHLLPRSVSPSLPSAPSRSSSTRYCHHLRFRHQLWHAQPRSAGFLVRPLALDHSRTNTVIAHGRTSAAFPLHNINIILCFRWSSGGGWSPNSSLLILILFYTAAASAAAACHIFFYPSPQSMSPQRPTAYPGDRPHSVRVRQPAASLLFVLVAVYLVI